MQNHYLDYFSYIIILFITIGIGALLAPKNRIETVLILYTINFLIILRKMIILRNQANPILENESFISYFINFRAIEIMVIIVLMIVISKYERLQS